MDFVGLTHLLRIPKSLKREALIFNRVAIYGTDNISGGKNFYGNEMLKELDWLFEQGIIKLLGRSIIVGEQEAALFRSKVWTNRDDLWTLEFYDFFSRIACLNLRRYKSIDAYPIFYTDLVTQSKKATKRDVIRILINSLPVPDEHTPWEQIIEYRSDPDSQSKFLALRHWMSEVARAELTPAEVEEKLEYLIDQYQQHMRLHRMKTNVGTLETIVTTGAEFLGDLVSFKWGKAAEALFSLKRRQVALLEGELTAPGNEVAYIVKARETFS